ncbi:hypothetical protein BGC31_16860 [Komagataeibacter xylinus]|nr:hypothetical protein H845_175 [Komagataeibacter xylinus E25]RFP00960.1 hypothetical protein BGC31_16860 [Komagataeibacter xylinus]RFP01256.1 hypothetical protein BFX83_06675 [Komagataeibacter xylinus]
MAPAASRGADGLTGRVVENHPADENVVTRLIPARPSGVSPPGRNYPATPPARACPARCATCRDWMADIRP